MLKLLMRAASRPLFAYLAIFAICFSSCTTPPSQPRYLTDLIEPLRLTAGKSDTILVSDLFYSENYDCAFSENDVIQIDYLKEKNLLILNPKETFEGATLISFRMGNAMYKIIAMVSRLEKRLFRFKAKSGVKSVNLMGNFNSWNRTDLPLDFNAQTGFYERSLQLSFGRYEYKFVVDGAEILDPENPVQAPNGIGGFNSILSLKDERPKAFLHPLEANVRGGETELNFWYDENPIGTAPNDTAKAKTPSPLASEIIALFDNRSIPPTLFKIVDQRVILKIKGPELKGEKTVRVLVSRNGVTTPLQTVYLTAGKPLETTESITPAGVPTPFKWNDAIVYSIVTDRFKNGDTANDAPINHPALSPKANFWGGDFAGIINKIETGYFDSLGVNTLWISPVNKGTDSAHAEYPPPHRLFSGYHGYWPTHHEEVEKRFGSMAQLKLLIAKAERRKMRVLLDFVGHHTHIDHPYFKAHPEWFGKLDLPNGKKNIRLFNEYRLTTWFEPYLPTFDFSNQEALEAMTDNALWWLKTTGAHGFRHDAVKHIPNEFWRLLTKKIKERIELPEKRKVYQIGETFGDYSLIKSYVNNGQLDAQFNFTLYDASLYTFLTPDANFAALSNELHKGLSVYGTQHIMGNLMDSHDKIRFMAYADGDLTLQTQNAEEIGWNSPPEVNQPKSYDKAKVFLAFIATIPGVPVVYYGDEIGLTGSADPDNRRPMRFSETTGLSSNEQAMLSETRALFRLRKAHSALRYGDFITLHTDTDLFAYLRSDMNERILVILNKSLNERSLQLELPSIYGVKGVQTLLGSGTNQLVGSSITTVVPPESYTIIKLQ
ncbi:MAG: alpha-amylase family glycosyl hydrolase [Chloroherpetonaceae bacterium]|nr:alpha-amylase family glycosyl hydrolase [Chloroherpetonaceae bacterium]